MVEDDGGILLGRSGAHGRGFEIGSLDDLAVVDGGVGFSSIV